MYTEDNDEDDDGACLFRLFTYFYMVRMIDILVICMLVLLCA